MSLLTYFSYCSVLVPFTHEFKLFFNFQHALYTSLRIDIRLFWYICHICHTAVPSPPSPTNSGTSSSNNETPRSNAGVWWLSHVSHYQVGKRGLFLGLFYKGCSLFCSLLRLDAMRVCDYICIYMYIYIYIYMHVCIHISVCQYVYICVYTYMYIYIYIYIYVYIHISIRISVHVCI